MMGFAGEKANRATAKAMDRAKAWNKDNRVSLPAEGVEDVLREMDDALTSSQSLDDLVEKALYIRMLFAAATHQ